MGIAARAPVGCVAYFGGALGPCGERCIAEAGRGAASRGLCGGHRRAGCHGDGAARAPSLAPARESAGQPAAGRRAGQAAALRGNPATAGLTLGPEEE